MDGITYCIIASMGFAMLENVVYTFEFGIGIGILRAFTAVRRRPFLRNHGLLLGSPNSPKTSDVKLMRKGLFAGVFSTSTISLNVRHHLLNPPRLPAHLLHVGPTPPRHPPRKCQKSRWPRLLLRFALSLHLSKNIRNEESPPLHPRRLRSWERL